MTPKEKAKELVDKYTTVLSIPLSKQVALFTVNEVLYVLNEVSEQDDNTYAYNAAVFYNLFKTELKNIRVKKQELY